MGEIPIWFFYLKEMYRGKFKYPEIRKKYTNNSYACKELFVEKEQLTNHLTGFDNWKRLFKVNRRLNRLLDYQIENYEKAYTLKTKEQ